MAGYDVNGAPLATADIVVSRDEWEALVKQVQEMHAFIKGIGEALNNPMLKSMLPPNMRNLV